MTPAQTDNAFCRRALRLGLILFGAVAASLAPAQQFTDGFLNQQRSEAPGTLLSHPLDNDSWNIGRTTTVQYLRGWMIVGAENPGSADGSDRELRVYDIEDPANPIRMFPSDFGLPYSSWHQGNFGFNAHGTAQSGNFMWPNTLRVQNWGGAVERGGDGVPQVHQDFAFGGFNRAAQAGPWLASMPWYGGGGSLFEVSKTIPDGSGGFVSKTLATFDHEGLFGGGDWHPMFFGDLLIYARSSSSASSDGVVVYRLAYNNFDDPDNMSVDVNFVGSLPVTFKGYWPNLYGSQRDALYVFGTDKQIIMLADITAAADPSVTGTDPVHVRTDSNFPGYPNALVNATYPVYQDQFSFVQRFKFDMEKFIAGAPQSDYIALELDEQANGVNTSQMSLPLGNLWLTGGSERKPGEQQGMAVWVQQQAADTTPPKVGYHIPQADRTNYPRFAPLSFFIPEVPRNGGIIPGEDFLVRRVNADGTFGSSVPGLAIHDMSGVFTFTPDSGLDADATYEVEFISDPANGKGFQDAAGNFIEPYVFRFSTGSDVVDGGDAPAISDVNADLFQAEPGETVTVSVDATGTNLEYRFRFEGTWTPWQAESSASHVFSSEGRFRVDVEVRNSSGTAADSVGILVATVPTAPAPTHSTTLAVGDDTNGRRVWAVNPDADTVSVFDASTGSKVAEHAVAEHPRNIARDAQGRYWVTCKDSDMVYVLNDDGSVFDMIDVGYGAGPFGAAPSPDGSQMYVTLFSSGQLLRFDTSTIGVPEIADTFPTPRAIAVSGDGSRVLVTRFISPDSHGEVAEYASDGTGLTLTRAIELGFSSLQDDPSQGSGVPNFLAGIAISPRGGHAIVASKQDNVARGEAFGRDPFTHDNTVRAVLSVIDIDAGQEVLSARQDFDNAEGPYAIDFTPLGDAAFVTLQGNNRLVGVDMLDPANPPGVSVVELVSAVAGLAPQGVLVDAASKRVFVQNFTGRSVTVHDATGFLDENVTSLAQISETAAVANEPLTAQELQGLQIFYNASDPRMSSEGYISCASCHIEGGHDGRVWDFTERGEGLRRTIDLRGRGGLDHGNVHWSANFDEIQDFEHDIRSAFAGQGLLDLTPTEFETQHPNPSTQKAGLSADLDALAAYVSSLGVEDVPSSPYRETDGSLTVEALNGRDLFGQLDCASCHSGANFTDSVVGDVFSASLSDVGTLAAFSGQRLGQEPLPGVDTPTLWGLHAARVYLHHGQADTLDKALAFAGGAYLDAQASATGTVLTGSSSGGGGEARGMLNNAYLEVPSGQSASWTGVDGGAGGTARVAVRYARGSDATDTLRVNGADTPLATFATPNNNPSSAPNAFAWAVADVALDAGAGNTVEYVSSGGSTVWIDGVLVANADQLTVADTHRQVLDLTVTEQLELERYLLSLDGSAGEAPPAPAPAAPMNLTAEAVSSSQIDLSWTAGDATEDGFRIERDSGSGFAQIAEVGSGVTSFSDASLAAETQYSYRVKAFNASGESGFSNTATATTAAATAPGTVDFEELTEDVGVPSPLTIDGFVFTEGRGEDFQVEGPGNGYDSIVILNQNWGTDITVTKDGGGEFDLVSFDYSAAPFGDNVTDAVVTGHFADSSTQTANYSTTTRAGQTLELNWAGLTSVEIDFAAGENTRFGGVDNFVFGEILQPPAAPTNLMATEVAFFQVDLSWTAGDATEDGFRVERDIGSGFAQVAEVGAGVTSYSDTGLEAETLYSYRVKAFNADGESGFSNTASATTPASGRIDFEMLTEGTTVPSPLATDGFVLTDSKGDDFQVFGPGNGYDSLVLLNGNWGASITMAKADGGEFDLASFDYSAAPFGDNVTDAVVTGHFADSSTQTANYSTTTRAGQTLELNWAGLTSVEIDFAAGENTRFGGVDNFVVDEVLQPPAAPSDLTATAVSDSRIDLSWTPGDATEDGFRIERDSGSGFAQIAEVGAGVTNFSDTNLAAGAQFAYRVKAFNADGESDFSNTAAATTLSVVDFETLTEDIDEPSPQTIGGFVFTEGRGEDFKVEGPGNGYDSIVILNQNWGTTITVTRDGGGEFDLASFEYSGAPFGDNLTDAVVTGNFADETTQTASYSTTTRAGQTLELNWAGLTSVVIDFAAGENTRFGGVDNFVIGGSN